MSEETKEILEKQLQLLSEASEKNKDEPLTLSSLTTGIVTLAQVLALYAG